MASLIELDEKPFITNCNDGVIVELMAVMSTTETHRSFNQDTNQIFITLKRFSNSQDQLGGSTLPNTALKHTLK